MHFQLKLLMFAMVLIPLGLLTDTLCHPTI